MYFRQIEDPLLAQYAYLIGCQQTGESSPFSSLDPGSWPRNWAFEFPGGRV